MVREYIVFGALSAVAAIVDASACSSTPSPLAAEALYGAQMGKCVDDNTTRAAIDACRAKVDAAWSVDAGHTLPPLDVSNLPGVDGGGK